MKKFNIKYKVNGKIKLMKNVNKEDAKCWTKYFAEMGIAYSLTNR